jgi:hypothetical protein
MQKTAVFTVILNDYDTVKPFHRTEGYDYILFTDNEHIKADGWEIRIVEQTDNPKLQSRHIKWISHKYLSEYDTVIYVDSSYQILHRFDKLMEKHFFGGILTSRHANRSSVWQEIDRVKELKFETDDNLEKVLKLFKDNGYKGLNGLWQNGFFIRDHAKETNSFCELLVSLLEGYTHRDQIILPYLSWKTGFKVDSFSYSIILQLLLLFNHKKKEPFRVWHIVPGRGDKDLGAAINMQIELIPDNDWICLRDGDTMFLHHNWPKQIEDIIKEHGNNFDLIGCKTNRLGCNWLLHGGKASQDPNVLNHYEIAVDLHNKHYSEVDYLDNTLAGFFMLFPKKTWNKTRFPEGLFHQNKFIDFMFSHQVYKWGRIGLAKGLYIFHFYRFNKNIKDISHLV